MKAKPSVTVYFRNRQAARLFAVNIGLLVMSQDFPDEAPQIAADFGGNMRVADIAGTRLTVPKRRTRKS